VAVTVQLNHVSITMFGRNAAIDGQEVRAVAVCEHDL